MQKKVAGILAVVMLLAVPVCSVAAVANNEVTSIKIKDGEVMTADIANKAVTAAKIADAIITATQLANGAVTDAKITGPISASKISSTGLNADTVDGKHASDFAQNIHVHSQSQVTGLEAVLASKADTTHNHNAQYQQKYGKVTVVAQSGGDYTNPAAAMNDVATWCGVPSSTNPCLVKIMPGVYDLGENTLFLKSYVDVDGSGENNTIIQGTGTVTEYYDRHVLVHAVAQATNYQLSNLTVNHLGANDRSLAICLYFSGTSDVDSIKVKNVTINVATIADMTAGIWTAHGYFDNITVNLKPAAKMFAFVYGDGQTGSNAMITNSRLNQGDIFNSGNPENLLRMVNVLFNGSFISTVQKLNVYDSNLTLR